MRRALVAANGYGRPAQLAAHTFDRIIAVDGGLGHLEALGRTPDVIVGDMDSVKERGDLKARYPDADLRVYPPEKNATDLELALELCLEEGIDRVLLIGAVGGRIDHELGNLYLIGRFYEKGIDITIETGDQRIFPLAGSCSIEDREGDLFSLIPLDTLTSVTLEGFAYPLDDFRLERGSSRGLSNVIASKQASVRLEGGLALVVLTKK